MTSKTQRFDTCGVDLLTPWARQRSLVVTGNLTGGRLTDRLGPAHS
ncbi:MAG: hypothetical protein JO147_05855 [Actinobacteria bacterium]|nr:hypothetical protein [Actinomycetota bacterium]